VAGQRTGAGSPGRERRAWIAAHHPDRGGNPQAFIAGLASSAWLGHPEDRNVVPVTAYRSRKPAAVLMRLARFARRARHRHRHRLRHRVI
jgi:hypothetical protein